MKYISFYLSFLFTQIIFSQTIIKNIKYSGLETTKKSFVEKFIKIQKGDSLEINKLEKETNFLKRLPAFSNVTYSIEKNNNDASVKYLFDEAYTLLPEINFWSADNQFTYRLGFNEYNLLGRGVHLNLAYQNNGKSSIFVNTKIPYLIDDFGIYLGFVSWKTDEPFYQNGSTFMYEYNNNSYEAMVLYDPNFYNHFEFGFNYFIEKYLALTRVSTNLPQKLNQVKFSLKFNYRLNKANWHFFYIDGIINSFYSQSVKTQNISNLYLIFLNDFMYFKRIGKSGNLATRFRFGLATNEDSPFSPFVLDNHVAIRGVGDRIDRGSGVLLLNVEYRHTGWETEWGAIQGVVFSDLGSWRSPGGSFADFTKEKSVQWHIGGGLRFIYKKAFNTILRIDYGFGIGLNKSSGIVLGFGQYF
ncbi:MAG: POTRA domain-containing protein [Melioribacteraceae bacterium]